MIRTVLVVAVLALGINAATAGPIEDRQALMKENGKMTRAAAGMVKGTAKFDLTTAKKVFATYADVAAKLPALFPDNSKTGGETIAAPKIWEDMAGFKMAIEKFGKDAKSAEVAVKDLDSFKTAFGNVVKNCNSCHDVYRVKKN